MAIPEPEPEEGVVFWFVGDIVGQTRRDTNSVKGTRLYCTVSAARLRERWQCSACRKSDRGPGISEWSLYFLFAGNKELEQQREKPSRLLYLSTNLISLGR